MNMTAPYIIGAETHGMPATEDNQDGRCGRCAEIVRESELVKCWVCEKKVCSGCNATKSEEQGDEFTSSYNVCQICLEDLLE